MGRLPGARSRTWFARIVLGGALPAGLLAAVVPEPPPHSLPVLRGKVASKDRAPIAGAVIRLLPCRRSTGTTADEAAASPCQAVSGKDGRFSLLECAGPTFTVQVSAEGKAPFVGQEVPRGAALDVRLGTGSLLRGKVRRLEDGGPLVGATVLACPPLVSEAFGAEACASVTSREEGTFAIPHVAEGAVEVYATAADRGTSVLRGVTIRPAAQQSAAVPLELFLGRGSAVRGRVTTTGGEPVSSAVIDVSSADAPPTVQPTAPRWPLIRSDDSGRFSIPGVSAGRYVVTARREGWLTARSEPMKIDGTSRPLDVTLQLAPAAALRVRLVTPEEAPVDSVEAQVIGPGSQVWAEGIRGKAVEGQRGLFEIGPLPQGKWSILLLPEGWADVVREDVTFRPGKTTDLGTITVKAGQAIVGRVTTNEGNAVSGAHVEAVWRDGASFRSRGTETGEDGRYRVGGLSAELAHVVASAPHYAQTLRDDIALGAQSADFVLRKQGTVLGEVRLPEGEPIPAFRVRLQAQADATSGLRPAVERLISDGTGPFRVEDVPPGTYTLEALVPGYAPARRPDFVIGDGALADVGVLRPTRGQMVRGRVAGALQEAPVFGASVALSPPRTVRVPGPESPPEQLVVSRSDGSFMMEGLESKLYEVRVSHPDYAAHTEQVEVAEEAPTELDIRLTEGGTVTGTVKDRAGQPVGGDRFVLRDNLLGEPERATAGPDGRYTFPRLTAGTYTVSRFRRGPDGQTLGLGTRSATVSDGQVTTLDWEDAGGVRASGRVLLGGEALAKEPLLFDFAGGGAGARTTRSDDTGRYTIDLEKGGTYRVVVGGPGSRLGSAEVAWTIPDQPEVSQDIIVEDAGIAGRVTDSGGSPIARASVTARPDAAESAGSREALVLSGPDGTYRLPGLRTGSYRVVAQAPGYGPSDSRTVAVQAGSSYVSVDLVLESGRRLLGRVIDARGAGIGNAQVLVTADPRELTATAVTDSNGDFSVVTSSTGQFDVAALASGLAPALVRGVSGGEGASDRVTLRLTPGGNITVHLTSSGGAPAGNQVVAVTALFPFPGQPLRRTGLTDANGVANVPLLTPGVYAVAVPARPEVRAVEAVVSEGAEARVTLQVP